MKLIIIIFLINSFSVFGQHDSIQTKDLFISGVIEFQNKDTLSKNKLGLVTNINFNDENKTTPFEISDEGYFMIDKLKKGTYKLIFRVNNDYQIYDTILTISKTSITELKIKLTKKPCLHEANSDIINQQVKIFAASGTSPRINNDEDNKFEKKFKIKYVILGDSREESWNCFKLYNDIIYDFLDNKYGKKWRRTVRKDVIGIE